MGWFGKNNRKIASLSSEELSDLAETYIAADVRLFSGCKDAQTSADVTNAQKRFSLEGGLGARAGGACTSALLKVLYTDHKDKSRTLTFHEVLVELREILSTKEFSQIPQLSSSRPLDVNETFTVIPNDFKGTRRALFIGINYSELGKVVELDGCHNDVQHMKQYIKEVHGFADENITTLMDDGKHTRPTKQNILKAFRKLVEESNPGDAVFFHYAGHGSKVKDLNGDEDDGYDETLVPVDYQKSGKLVDDQIFETFVCPMAEGVTMTCVVDCCHSGTVLDLPFMGRAITKENVLIKAQEKLNGTIGETFPHMKLAEKIQKSRKVASNANATNNDNNPSTKESTDGAETNTTNDNKNETGKTDDGGKPSESATNGNDNKSDTEDDKSSDSVSMKILPILAVLVVAYFIQCYRSTAIKG